MLRLFFIIVQSCLNFVLSKEIICGLTISLRFLCLHFLMHILLLCKNQNCCLSITLILGTQYITDVKNDCVSKVAVTTDKAICHTRYLCGWDAFSVYQPLKIKLNFAWSVEYLKQLYWCFWVLSALSDLNMQQF